MGSGGGGRGKNTGAHLWVTERRTKGKMEEMGHAQDPETNQTLVPEYVID